jgi:RHS repeat-associated protein
VDAQINPVDSAGDEGAIFAELVQGNSLDVATLEALRGENDQTIIIVNGEIIQVEQTNLTGTSNNDNITGTSLTLTSETGYAVGTTTPVTGTINNDDTNVTLAVSFSRANFQIGEDGKAFVPVTINLTGGSGNSGNGSVTLSLADGTATTFQDYNLQTFTINFNPGETTKTLQISIINDAVAESSETINLTLSNPTGNIILGTQKTATLTIIDNDTVWAGFADVVLDYFDSGTGPIPGPYGFIGSAGTTPINLDAALGNDPNSSLVNTVTLPTGSYITLGFIDETIINGPGNDIFVREDGAAGDRANVFVSSNLIDFTFLGVAQDNITTAFDLSSINYTETVRAVKIVGLNLAGTVPGFDLVNVQVLNQGSAAGKLAFETANFSINENGTPVTEVNIIRTDGSYGQVSATINLTNGTAITPSDYTNTPITVNFANGETSKTVTIPIVNDTEFETDETVNLTLSNPTGGAILGTQTTATLTIVDNDLPMVSLAVSPARVIEDGTTNLIYTFTRNGVISNPLTVNYTVGGTATFNTDYTQSGAASFTSTTGTVTFAANATTATVTVDPTADTTVESNETVILTLAAGTGYTVGTTTAVTGTIFDLLSQGLKGQYYDGYFDDNLGFFSQQSPLLTRIDTNVNFLNNSTSWNLNTIPQLADLETFSSQWNGYINIPVTGNYTFYINSDDASYLFLDNATLAPTPTNATINNGGLHVEKEVSTTVNLTAGLHNILLLFGEKTVQNIMQFSWSSSDANIAKQIVPSSALFNDGQLAVGSLAFSSPTFSVNEDGTPVTIVTINRTGGSSGAVSARINLTNGTATAPSDYNNTAITVNFAAGEISKTVTVPIVNDTFPEPDETVQLILTNPTGGATIGGQNTATLNIVDNDAAILITGFPQGSQGSNLGKSTIIIAGQNFSPTDKISIISPTGTETLANQVYWVNKTEAWATFNLQGLATGQYDVKVMNGINTYTSNDTFNVNNGSLGNLDIDLSYPAKGFVRVTYKNIGRTDLIAPLLRINATNATVNYPEENTISATLKQLLNLSLATSDNGPAGILAPGESGEFYFQYTPNGNGLISFSVDQVPANEVINWATIKAESRADYSFIDNAGWDALWSNLTASLGTTAGQFQAVMAENANYLSQLGQETSDLTRLFAFEWKQAVNTLTNVDLISTTDVVDTAPGLSLTFNRTFYQSIAERYNLGTLGRGWSSQWDLRATTNSQGDVVIRSVGDLQRLFEKQTDGTFLDDDGAKVTITNGQYTLKETSGLVSFFGTDGKLNYVQDTNSNRITLQYTNGQLTKLLHTNGDSLTLTYNAQGRINQITDSAGQATTYTYNSTGENLLSVTGVDGTITYSYDTGTVAAKKHSLLSVTSDLGYQRSFEYDNQGRLTKESSNGNTQTLTYSYDSVGGVTVTDSTGASETILLDDRGNRGQIRGVNNQNLLFNYDADGNLLGVTLPNGSQSGYTYDSKGNLTQQTNLLGQKTNFTYDATFNQLTGFTDPKGNGVSYSYDTKGNLNKITYSDGSTQQFTIDALGNITSSVNRRGSNISYTYNTSGLLTKKQYADGSSVNYSYDTRGNLTSVVDGTGTMAMQYDTANRLTKITYPNGRSLSYTYNADGQRTKLVSSDDYTVNYTYDTVGRLKSLTNATGQNIITYDYDSAGRLIKETNGNGTYTTYEYDLQDQLTKLVNYKANNTVNSQYQYTYDNLGRRNAMTTLDGVFKYGYDAIGQLTSVITPTNRTITYTYDAAGNRIGVTDSGVTTNYTTNNLNQYSNVGNGVYTYDTDGNLISKTQGGQTSNYTYDAESRLVKVVTPSGTWEYQYDGLGNRTATTVNGQKTEYLVDPFGFGDVVGEYNNNSLVANYTYGIGLVSRVNGSNSNYYDADAIGSTVGLTASDGSYVNKYSYLPFGEDLTKVEAVANPFEYVGQWGVTDEGNGLDFMRARFYDTSLGRFTSVDPIGLNGGDTNFYRYVGNNPNTYSDPSGQLVWLPLLPAAARAAAAVAWAWRNRETIREVLEGLEQTHDLYELSKEWQDLNDGNPFNPGDPRNPFDPANPNPIIPIPLPEQWPLDPTNPLNPNYPFSPNNPNTPFGPFNPNPITPIPLPDQPPLNPNPNKGGTYNDPHLKTLDGLGYDFQTVGEFTLIKSTTDDFEIQTRQQPWGSSTSASANTAISIKSGGQRIALYANQTNPLLINGTAVTLPEGGLYAVGQNLITREGSKYSIITANNDLILVSNRGTFLNINLGLADNRQSKVIGLLGNFNNNRNDDFALRNGTVIGGTITDQRLYGDYAASWRITQATSLFDYASGQTTATFTDLTFPKNVITTASLTPAQRAAAEQIARNAGITDPSVLEDVILDIHLSNGDTTFIEGAINGAINQQRLETVNAPNTIINPDGLGSQHLLPSNSVIPYTIRFSNNAAAGTTPVAQVTITQTLDSDLDLNTFTLDDINFGTLTLDVPTGVQNYSQRLDLRTTRGVFVDVNADLNTSTRVLTWTFIAIDTTTGNPANSTTQGFLPPNDANGSGSGFVGYSIQPKANSPSNTRIDAQASITLNTQTIQTNPVFNTVGDTSVTLAVSPSSVTEDGTTNLVYTFTRTGATTDALTVNYTVGGTATFNTDYTQTGAASFTSTTGTVSFAANSATATVTVDPTTDTTVEPDETVALTLASGTGYAIGTTEAVVGIITDNDNDNETPSNQAPTDLALSATTVNENVAPNTVIGTFSSTDPDTGNSFTYSLVVGTGDTDNSAFSIVGNQLQINNSPDFETKNSYSIRVKTTDQGGLGFEKVLVITVNDLNETPGNQAPTDLALSATTVNENVAPNTVIGTFSSTDPDTGNSFTYSLVVGTGDTDNTAFSIVGNQLQINNSPDFETKNSYSIRVKTTDQGGLGFEKVLVITVNDLNETPGNLAPTDLALSATTVNENVAPNTVIGTFSSTDPDTGNSFTYSLIAGTGDTDNTAFSIVGNQLQINNSPDFETKNSYSIRVKTTDQGGLSFEKVLVITVNDVNETPGNLAPTALIFQNAVTELAENVDVTPEFKVADLLIEDDGLGTNNLSLTGRDRELFLIRNSALFYVGFAPNFEAQNSYEVTVNVDDPTVGVTPDLTQTLTLNITDVNEAPTALILANSTKAIAENTDTSQGVKVADIQISDDALGTNSLSLLGSDQSSFQIRGRELFFIGKADFEAQSLYNLTVAVTDTTLKLAPNATPDATVNFTLEITNLPDQAVNPQTLQFKDTGNGQGSLVFNFSNLPGSIQVTAIEEGLKQTGAFFNNVVGLYPVADDNGAVFDSLDLDGDGNVTELIQPGQAGYARTALSQAVNNFILQASGEGANQSTTAAEFGDVLLEGGRRYAPFVIANGGNLGESLQGSVQAFLAKNPDNVAATLENYISHEVAYFSFGSANPDGAEHLRSRGNNIFGFEDLPGNLPNISDNDFNDGILAFNFIA